MTKLLDACGKDLDLIKLIYTAVYTYTFAIVVEPPVFCLQRARFIDVADTGVKCAVALAHRIVSSPLEVLRSNSTGQFQDSPSTCPSTECSPSVDAPAAVCLTFVSAM